MLRVKTRLGLSTLDGLGLFADQFISANTVIWEFNPLIDLKLREDEIATLAEGARQQVQRYSYKDEFSGLYIFCGDDARFFNTSEDPNCVNVSWGPFGGRTIANRDISEGEELTCSHTGTRKLTGNQYSRRSERRNTHADLPQSRFTYREITKH